MFAPPAVLLVMVPTLALPPGMPFTSHAIAEPVEVQNEAVKSWVCPSETFALAGEIEFVGHVIVTLALPVFVLSATLVAVTVTFGGEGGTAGAVYVALSFPLATIVPTAELPPAIPFTLHVTPVAGLSVPVTVATKTCAPNAGTVADAGDTFTVTSSIRITLADELACASATLTAVTVTVVFAGRMEGAV